MLSSSAVAVTVSSGATFTVTAAVVVQPFTSVTSTVYVVVAEGLAVGVLLFGSLRPATGDHRYVYPGSPPLAVTSRCATEVGHVPMMSSSVVATAVSAGATVMVTFAVVVHPLLSVTVTVYVVVARGLATGDCIARIIKRCGRRPQVCISWFTAHGYGIKRARGCRTGADQQVSWPRQWP